MDALHPLKTNNGMGRMLTLVVASLFLISLGMVSHNAFAQSVVDTIPLCGGASLEGLAYDSAKGEIFVTTFESNSVCVISDAANTIVASVWVGSGPLDVAYDSAQGEIFVTNYNSGTVSVISDATNTVVATIPVGTHPVGITYDSAQGEIFVTNTGSNTVSVISDATNTVVDTIPMGSPVRVAYDSAKGEIFVSHGISSVSVISDTTNTVVAKVTVGATPDGVAYDSAQGEIFVTNYDSNTVSVISDTTNTVVATVSVGTHPFGAAYDSAKGEIFVTNGDSKSVSVISDATNTVVDTITVKSPGGVAYDPTTDEIFVADSRSNTTSVINDTTNTVVATIPVGKTPQGVVYDSVKGEIFVANDGSNTISVIDDGTSETSTIPTLQVNSQDSYGNDLPGFYTKLYAQNGTQIDSGYTPNIFTLDNGQTYTIHVGNSVLYKFNHWLDTGSTDVNRTISITSDKSITAVYATIPTHPSNLTATAVSPSEINLSWNAPSSDGGSPITGYRIQISTDDSTWTTIVKDTGNTSTTYSDTGLSSDTTYYYRVFALNSVGSSYRSNIASATTPILTVAEGGITLGNIQSTSGTTSSSNQMTLSGFNVGTGSNQLLLVGVSTNNNNVTSVTFGGVPLARAAYSYTNNDAEFWYLTNPTGSGDITVTFWGPTQAVVGAYSFSGVNQTLPIPTHVVKHNTSPNSPNISITTQYANDLVLDLASIYGGSTLSSPACAQQWDANVPDAITGASSSTMVQSPGAVTCSWTASSADFWDDAAVEINAANR